MKTGVKHLILKGILLILVSFLGTVFAEEEGEIVSTPWGAVEVGAIDETISELNNTIAAHPDDAEAYLNRGYLKETKREFDAAILDLTKALELRTNYDDAYYCRGFSYLQSGNPGKALEDFDNIRETKENSAKLHLAKAGAKTDSHDYDGATEDCDFVINLHPRSSSAYLLMGRIAGLKGQPEEAIKDFDKVIEIDPGSIQAYVNRGIAKEKENDFDGAINDFTTALLKGPDSPFYIFRDRATAESRIGNLDDALFDLDSAIALKGDYTNAYFLRGGILREKGEYTAAIASYSVMIGLDTNVIAGFDCRGQAKMQAGDIAGAKADYDTAIKLGPDNSRANLAYANFNFDLQKRDVALKYYQKAVDLKGDGKDYANFRLWITRVQNGDGEAATQALNQYLLHRVNSKTDDWPPRIGRFLTGLITETEFLKVAKSENEHIRRQHECEAYFYIGEKQLIQGEKENAKKSFMKCLATKIRNYDEYVSATFELKNLEK